MRTPSAHDNDWTAASAQNVEAEDPSVNVLKRGGRVTINNVPYERQGATDDRETLNTMAFTYLEERELLNPRFVERRNAERRNTELHCQKKKQIPPVQEKKLFFFQGETKRGSDTPNPLAIHLPGWTQVCVAHLEHVAAFPTSLTPSASSLHSFTILELWQLQLHTTPAWH